MKKIKVCLVYPGISSTTVDFDKSEAMNKKNTSKKND